MKKLVNEFNAEELMKLQKKDLVNKILEFYHMKTTIEAKDAEISKLTVALGEKEREILDINSSLDKKIELRAEQKFSQNSIELERLKKETKVKVDLAVGIATKKSQELQELLDSFKATLRVVQGGTDMAVSLLEYFENKVKKGD